MIQIIFTRNKAVEIDWWNNYDKCSVPGPDLDISCVTNEIGSL